MDSDFPFGGKAVRHEESVWWNKTAYLMSRR